MIMDVINYKRRGVMNAGEAGEYFCVSLESVIPFSFARKRRLSFNSSFREDRIVADDSPTT